MEIIKYLINGSLFTGAIVFISKLFFSKMFEMLEDKYKNKLNVELEEFKHDNQKMIEAVKADYQKLLDKNKIIYERLHRERTDIIVEIYKKLARLEPKIENFLNSVDNIRSCDQISDELNELVYKGYIISSAELSDDMFDDFYNYVSENSIFFTDNLTKSLDELSEKLITVKILKGIAEDEIKAKSHKLNEALKFSNDRIKKIKKEIQNEFRSLLGIV